jgi:hypothetical protein
VNIELTARLIGLLSHFIYWVIFGHVNPNPLSSFHLKQLFISIMQCINTIEKENDRKKVFCSFIMPLILLTIRLEIETIYKNTYPQIMNDPESEPVAMRLISAVITEILDPKLYYSRFSFLESGKEAIDIKYKMFRRPGGMASTSENSPSPFLPNVKNKYNTRSTLVKNLFPMPSEGKVRAMFIEPSTNLTNPTLPKI